MALRSSRRKRINSHRSCKAEWHCISPAATLEIRGRWNNTFMILKAKDSQTRIISITRLSFIHKHIMSIFLDTQFLKKLFSPNPLSEIMISLSKQARNWMKWKAPAAGHQGCDPWQRWRKLQDDIYATNSKIIYMRPNQEDRGFQEK